jgi:hypothetical protein
MRDVATVLPPIDIVNRYQASRTKYGRHGGSAIPNGQTKTSAIATDMWPQLPEFERST